MTGRFARWIVTALIAAGSIVTLTPAAPARAAAGGLSIGPFLQEVTLEPGQTDSSFRITVTNTTKTELPLRLSVVDFGAADEAGGINFLPSADNLERRYGLASWMRLEKDSLVLAPGSVQQVMVTVENRESLSPGGHYGAVIFEVDTDLGSGEIQPKVNFTKAVSTLVLAKKIGGERQSMTLTGSTWSGPPFSLPREAKLRFLNNGNVHATARGDVTLTDSFGRVIGSGQLNQESTVVLPESLRVYPVKLVSQGTLWLPGWVTLTIRYKVSDTARFTTTTSSFFIATPRSVVVTIGLLLVVVATVRYRKHVLHQTIQVGKQGRVGVKKVVHRIKHRRKKRPSSKP